MLTVVWGWRLEKWAAFHFERSKSILLQSDGQKSILKRVRNMCNEIIHSQVQRNMKTEETGLFYFVVVGYYLLVLSGEAREDNILQIVDALDSLQQPKKFKQCFNKYQEKSRSHRFQWYKILSHYYYCISPENPEWPVFSRNNVHRMVPFLHCKLIGVRRCLDRCS